MVPSVAPPAVHDGQLVLVFLAAVETAVCLEVVFSAAGFPEATGLVVHPVPLDFEVESVVEFFEFLDAIADAVLEVLVALEFLVLLAVYLEEGFVIGFDNIDIKVVTFSTLGVEGLLAALVVAGDGESDHVAADGADGGVLLAAVDAVQSLDCALGQVVGALGVEHEAADMDVPALFLLA